MLLAGDVGGTKTRLGLFEPARERPAAVHVQSFATLQYDSLASMILEFVGQYGRRTRIQSACFGVAGPVRDQVARLTNVPWSVDAGEIGERCGVGRVKLLNDLEAMAYAVPALEPDELAVLQEGEVLPNGNAALIAAGTGLGEASLHNIDGRFIPSASEGGHADFAARTPREIELLRELTRIYGRVDCEHVISGPGLVNIYRFTHPKGCEAVDLRVHSSDLPRLISASGLDRRCPLCVEALDLFVSAYGSEAGNLALRSVATAGVYVGGGIAPKILSALESGAFIDAFRAKEPLADLLAAMPVSVILNAQAGLLGAAVHANAMI